MNEPQGPGPDDFFECGDDLETVEAMGPAEAAAGPDPDEAPALRDIGRPPCWTAPTSPEALLSGIYASAARRAFEVLSRRDG